MDQNEEQLPSVDQVLRDGPSNPLDKAIMAVVYAQARLTRANVVGNMVADAYVSQEEPWDKESGQRICKVEETLMDALKKSTEAQRIAQGNLIAAWERLRAVALGMAKGEATEAPANEVDAIVAAAQKAMEGGN